MGIDIIGPFPKIRAINRFLLVIPDLYINLTKMIPFENQTSSVTPNSFLIHWIYNLYIPDYLLSDNMTDFVAKFIYTVLPIHYSETFYLIISSAGQCPIQTVQVNKYKPLTKIRYVTPYGLGRIYPTSCLGINISNTRINSYDFLILLPFKTPSEPCFPVSVN